MSNLDYQNSVRDRYRARYRYRTEVRDIFVILIGFMGSGKSTVARRLSQMLQRPCVEMDELVCQRVGVPTMGEVFSKGGELLLREMEIEIAKEYAKGTPPVVSSVVSTGGGVVLNKIVLDYFRTAHAKVYFLHVEFDSIVTRLQGDTSRPLLSRAAYDFRRPLYASYADEIIDVGNRSVEEIALQVKGFSHGL